MGKEREREMLFARETRLTTDEKVNAHLPYYSTLKKFWNGFFQTFQAGLLFCSGGKTYNNER